MTFDKKRSGKTLRFIIPQGLGDVVVIDDPGTRSCAAPWPQFWTIDNYR